MVEFLCDSLGPDDQVFVNLSSHFTFDYYWPKCNSIYMTGPHSVEMIYFDHGKSNLIGASLESDDHNDWMVVSNLKPQEIAAMLTLAENGTGMSIDMVYERHGAWLYLINPRQ